MHLEWKNWRNNLMGPFLLAGPSLEKWGLKPSKSALRYQMMFFGVKLFHRNATQFHAILQSNIFLSMQEVCQ